MLPSRTTLAVLAALAPLTAQEERSPEASRQPSFPDSRFTSLFDGETLAGWTTKGGRYDGKAEWTVEDGAIVGRQGMRKGKRSAGGLIYTERHYGSFVLKLETKVDYPFDSGIFLHMVPRKTKAKGMQVTIDYRPNGEVGGIYADGWLQHNREGKAKFKKDDWNEMIVRCTGRTPRVEVWLNGELITDFRRKSDDGFSPTGKIGLQVHGGRDDPGVARFRNVRIQELPTFDHESFTVDASGMLSARAKSGWTQAFNGEDLTGWKRVGGNDKGYVVRDGVLSFPKEGGGGYLRTEEEYRDFRLRLDFKVGFMANSGVFLRAAPKGNPAFSGCEVQILDDFNWEKVTGSKLKPYQFTGGLYGSVPPGVRALHEIGRWNTFEITYQGSRLRVDLNGQTLYDVDTHTVPGNFAKRAAQGFIGLQRHAPGAVKGDAYAWFRNIFIKKL